MKKMFRGIGRLLRRIATFFDKWLITPITKLVLNITEFIKSNSKSIDRIIGRKSTLLVISLILAFAVFVIIDQESDIMIDKYAEILENQPVSAIYNEELYVVEGIPKTVDITLIGQRRHIFLAKQSPSKNVSVDLTGLKPGTHSVTLKYTQRLKSLEYKLDPSKITVKIYDKESETRSLTYDILHQDDLDSKLGRVRLRDKGCAGGHNGHKNISMHLKTEEYKRIKLGIDRDKNIAVVDWVLKKFTADEILFLEPSFDKAILAIEDFINDVPFVKIASLYSNK